jgi:Zn-dependent M28 family amino/carboxypeptidase
MAITLTTCKKDISEEEKREAVIRTLLQDISADSVRNHVVWLQDMGARFSLADNHREIAVKIKKKFQDLGYMDAALDSFNVVKTFRNVLYEQKQYNVIASIGGTDYPDSVCVVGGHYDDVLSTSDLTVVPGANDNASGTSAVLEIARVMKKNNYKPKSTILFIAFGAEEIGLLGSRDFAANPNEYSGKIRFMLNSDMIAFETSEAAADWYINIMDYSNSHTLRLEAEKICTTYTLLSPFNDNTNSNRSDSYPFFTNGYKALFFFSGDSDPNYHTLNDVAANCNFDYCAEVVKLQCALLANKN